MRNLCFVAWVGLAACVPTEAAIVTTPAGLQTGDQYQLVFVTADTFDATSTDISTYNAEVTAEAALDPDLAAFDALNGVTWNVIGSTATVNANVNAPSTGSVYTLNGTMVASPAQSLYSDQCPITAGPCPGPLSAPIDITQFGALLITSAWTGSLSGGVAAGDPSLGYDYSYLGATADPSHDVTQGCTPEINSGWADCDYNPNTELFGLYAISSVITVPTPEPGTATTVVGGLLLLTGIMRKGRISKSRYGCARIKEMLRASCKTILWAVLLSESFGAQSVQDIQSDLRALPHGLYYRSVGGWTKLELAAQSGISTTHGASALAGVPPGAVGACQRL